VTLFTIITNLICITNFSLLMKVFFGKPVSSEFVENKLSWDKDNSVKKTANRLAKKADIKIKYCYICNKKNFKKLIKFYGINYVKCQTCGLVFTDRVLSPKLLNQYYKKNSSYFSEAYTDKNNIKLRDKLLRPKVQFIKKFIESGKWLDVGAAEGSIVDAALKEGFQAEGIEISQVSRVFSKKFRKITLHPGTLETFVKTNTKKWDVISFYGVIDVVPNPIELLELAKKILSKKGIIVFQVPNYDSGSTLVQKLINTPDRHLKPPLNFKLFTLKSIQYCLRQVKMKPLAVWYSGMDMIEFIKYVRKLDKNFKNSDLDKFLRDNLNIFQQIFDDNSMSDMMAVVAKPK